MMETTASSRKSRAYETNYPNYEQHNYPNYEHDYQDHYQHNEESRIIHYYAEDTLHHHQHDYPGTKNHNNKMWQDSLPHKNDQPKLTNFRKRHPVTFCLTPNIMETGIVFMFINP